MNKLCECGCGGETPSETARYMCGHQFRDPKIREKIKQKCLKNYGVENPSQSIILKEKKKETCLKNHGVEYSMQSKEVQEKSKNTCNKHFGSDYPLQSKEIYIKHKSTMIKKYGVEHNSQLQENKEKYKQTNLKNLGVEYPLQSKEIQGKSKQTCLKKYGVENPFQLEETREKWKRTMIEKYGVEHNSQSNEVKEKKIQTSLMHYGTTNPMHCQEVQEKCLKSSYRRKEYILQSGKNILLQGEEPYFLDYVFSNNLLKEDEIIYHPKGIKYLVENKNHYYYPDFFVPKFNLIVEVKSWYILSIQKNTDLKIDSTKSLGYKYILILDKKYDEFTNLIKELECLKKN